MSNAAVVRGTSPRQPVAPTGGPPEFDLWAWVRSVLRRWWIVAITTVVCSGVAWATSSQSTPSYVATGVVALDPAFAPLPADLTTLPNQDVTRILNTQALIVQSDRMRTATASRLGVETTSIPYADATVNSSGNSLSITVSGTTPDAAMRTLEAYLAQYQEDRKQFATDYLVRQVDQDRQFLRENQAQLDEIQDAARRDPQNVSLVEQQRAQARLVEGARQRYESAASQLAGVDTGLSVLSVGPATGTAATERTDARNNGAVMGLILGALIVVLLDALDRSFRSQAAVQSVSPVPVIGELNRPRWPGGSIRGSGAAAALAAMQAADSPIAMIVAVRPKTGLTLARAMAATVSQQGHTVAVLDCTRRQDMVEGSLDAPPGAVADFGIGPDDSWPYIAESVRILSESFDRTILVLPDIRRVPGGLLAAPTAPLFAVVRMFRDGASDLRQLLDCSTALGERPFFVVTQN